MQPVHLSPLSLWVPIPLRRGVLDTALYDKVCQLLAAGQSFSPCTLVFTTNKSDHHDIAEILLKVALNTVTLPHPHSHSLIEGGRYFTEVEVLPIQCCFSIVIKWNVNHVCHFVLFLLTIVLSVLLWLTASGIFMLFISC
jgi:hypothetical protein